MAWLVIGLIVFLGVHSVRIVAEGWRTQMLAEGREGLWKGVYSGVSLLGFALLIWGYGQTRLDPVWIWHPPAAMQHVAAMLMVLAFVLLAAAYVPRNRLRLRVGHPMVLAVKVWALAHLLSNGRLGDIVLFGAFLLWAVADFASARRRDRAVPPQASPDAASGSLPADVATAAIGLVAYMVFALWLHRLLIGVAPFSA